jgi:hypothetical protein
MPAGTSTMPPTDDTTPTVLRLKVLAGALPPGRICPSVLTGHPVKSSTPLGAKARPPSIIGAVACGAVSPQPHPTIRPAELRSSATR